MADTIKKTKRIYFGELKEIEAVKSNPDLVAFIDNELALLDKKANAKSKADKVKDEKDEIIMTNIVEAMAKIGEPATVTNIQKASEELAGLSNQKLSAMMRKLIANGEVVRVDEKKSLFAIAE